MMRTTSGTTENRCFTAGATARTTRGGAAGATGGATTAVDMIATTSTGNHRTALRAPWPSVPRASRHALVAVVALCAVLIPQAAAAQSADAQDATEIMQSVDEQQDAETSAMRISMHVFDRAGSAESRDMYIESYGRGDDESYMEFVSPRSIKGLRVQDLDGDVRVFFPSTGRVRRIASGQKSGSIGGVGGDFSYEDMGGGSLLEEYEFTLLREEGETCLIRGVPTDPESSYDHLVYYVDTERTVITRIEYYTPDDGHEKTMTAESFERIEGRLMATQITMENHRKHRRTVLRIHDARFDVALDDRYFNPNRFYR